MPNLLLAGYLGCGNLGDDAILLGFVEGLRDRNYNFMVMSGAPEETYRTHGLSSLPRRDAKQFDEALAQCDALVFPGGSIFQDSTSVASVSYYAGLIKKAKSANKKVIAVGQGVGPLNNFLGKRMAAGAFNMCDAIAVRDAQSVQTLKSIGVKQTPRITADCAFMMPDVHVSDDAPNFNVGGMKTIGVSARGVAKVDVATLFGDFCRLLYQSGSLPVLIEMDRAEDGPLIEKIEKAQGGKIPDIRKLQSPKDMQQRIMRMEAVVATRLHAGILAATVNVPPLMVSYDPKVAAFAKSLDLGSALNLDGSLTAQRMFDVFQSFMKNRDRNAKITERKRDEMRKAAEQNVEIVATLVR